MATSRGPVVGAAAIGVMVLLLASCAESGHRFVKNSSEGVYFKIPRAWEFYDEDAVVKSVSQGLSPQEEDVLRQVSWNVGFDADPEPSIKHLQRLLTDHPKGRAHVAELEPAQRDSVSLGYLRNLVVPVDELLAQDESNVQVLDREDVTHSGFHGVRFKFNVKAPESGKFVTFDQVALVDDKTSQVYLFVVSCEARCFEDNNGTIDKVVDSWTVKDN
jgi:hypothetical protein